MGTWEQTFYATLVHRLDIESRDEKNYFMVDSLTPIVHS